METPPIVLHDSVCPVCGWTASQLRDTGRMGCAACYTAFESMVVQATIELHRAASPPRERKDAVPEPLSLPPSRTSSSGTSNVVTDSLPWATRRGTTSRKP